MIYALIAITFIIWGILGILYFWCAKPPHTNLRFFLNLFLSGPLVWILLGVSGIMVLNEKRKIDRGNEEYFNHSGEN